MPIKAIRVSYLPRTTQKRVPRRQPSTVSEPTMEDEVACSTEKLVSHGPVRCGSGFCRVLHIQSVTSMLDLLRLQLNFLSEITEIHVLRISMYS